MKVMYVDQVTPRSDGRKGSPTGVTVGKVYEVLQWDDQFFTIMNDRGKRARYSKVRFITPPDYLVATLTHKEMMIKILTEAGIDFHEEGDYIEIMNYGDKHKPLNPLDLDFNEDGSFGGFDIQT
jgi:hypothetical protein